MAFQKKPAPSTAFKKGRKSSNPGPKKDKNGLTPQMKRLVDEYFKPENKFVKRRAMLAAGYSETTAQGNPMSVFNHPAVAAEIARRQEDLNERFAISPEWVLRKRMLLAEANPVAIYAKLEENDWDVSKLTWEEQFQLSEIQQEEYKEGRGEGARWVLKTKVKAESRDAHLAGIAKQQGYNKENDAAQIGASIIDILAAGRKRVKKAAE